VTVASHGKQCVVPRMDLASCGKSDVPWQEEDKVKLASRGKLDAPWQRERWGETCFAWKIVSS